MTRKVMASCSLPLFSAENQVTNQPKKNSILLNTHIHAFAYIHVSACVSKHRLKNKKNVSSSQANPSIKLCLNFHILLMEFCYLLQPASLLNRLSVLFLVHNLGLRHSLNSEHSGRSGTIKKWRISVKGGFLVTHELQRNANTAKKQAQITPQV